MNTRAHSMAMGLLALAACLAPSPLGAQGQAGAGPRAQGVFQGGGGAGSERQSLSLSISLVEAYDSNLQAGIGAVRPTPFQQSGFYTGLTPTMNFASRGRSVQFGATAGSNLRYYGDLDRLVTLGHNVGAGFAARVGRRTTLTMNQGVAYAPAYLHGLFAGLAPAAPGDVANPAPNYAVNGQRSYRFSTTAALTRTVSERNTVSFSSGFQYTNFVGNPQAQPDLQSFDVGGRFTHTVSRDASIRLGYRYRRADYVGATFRPTTHDLDAGVDYLWPLSRTRRTTLGLSGGSSVVDGPIRGSGGVELRRQYRAVGDAVLSHQIGRSWQLQGVYQRGLRFVDGLADPVFSDAVTVSTSGLIGRRTDVRASASYSTGATALTAAAANFDTYTADTQVRFALSPTWATYVEYVYYVYNFHQGQVPTGVSPDLRRHGVRVGLTLWVPLMRRQ